MRELILELSVDAGMSLATVAPTSAPAGLTYAPTRPTYAPTVSPAPTFTDCSDPGTCANRLLEQIYRVSERVGTVEAQADPESAQSRARDWIIEECGAVTPIEYCGETQLLLNEQRYALAVMYFSLGGDGWNAGSNPGPDKGAGEGRWLSGMNYCDWGSEITSTSGSYRQLECDEFGNVLYLNMRESFDRDALQSFAMRIVCPSGITHPSCPDLFVRRIQQHGRNDPTRNRRLGLPGFLHIIFQRPIWSHPHNYRSDKTPRNIRRRIE
jgi:hypothetical protein